MKNIIDTLIDAGKFTTLVGLLKTASFCDTLRTSGPYTLFAPTDDAFKALAPDALDALQQSPDRLYAVLAHHVACDLITAQDMTSRDIRTMAGTSLAATVQDGDAFANGARIVQADIAASNGVIHMIHSVLMPPETRLAAA